MTANDLVAALRRQLEYWQDLPGGIDYDADPENRSPVDATAHIAGLAVRDLETVLRQWEEQYGNLD